MVVKKKAVKKKNSKKKLVKKVVKKAVAKKKLVQKVTKKKAVKKKATKKKVAQKKVAKKKVAKKKVVKKKVAKKKVAKKKVAKKVVKKKVVKKKATKKAVVKKKVVKKPVAKKKVVKKKVTKEKAVKKSQPKKKTASKTSTDNAHKAVKKQLSDHKEAAQETPMSLALKAAVTEPVKDKQAESTLSNNKEKHLKLPHQQKEAAYNQPVADRQELDDFEVKVEDVKSMIGAVDFSPYTLVEGEEYMNERQMDHFRTILTRWKAQLMGEVDNTMVHMHN